MNNRILKNATWIIVCKIVQSILSFIIGTLTVRYLGPSNYGIITYAVSVVSFLIPIMQLGLNNTLVKEFIENPNNEGEILGTALTINVISSLFSILGAFVFVSIANAGERETIFVCALYSLVLLFQATEMTIYWFQSKLLSKYPSVATLIAYVIVAIYKVYLLVTGKSIAWFAMSYVLDFFLISLILLVIYLKLSKQKLSINWEIGHRMLSRSKYFIVPSLMIVVFRYTDHIMLKLMVSDVETGLFSAAIACTGMTGFVFHAIVDSARTVILEAKERSSELYERRIVQLYSIITALALAQSIGITIFAKPIIYLLYGEAFSAAVPILQVAVWYDTFGYYCGVRNIWVLAEEKQKHLTKINIIGALTNVVLNACLIPFFGGVGAAIASIISQFFTIVIIGYIYIPIRHNNYLMQKGLNPKVMVGVVLSILSFKKKKENKQNNYIVTAGSNYLDIDAYACMVAMAELFNLQGMKVVAYSKAPCNYSVCDSLVEENQIMRKLPSDISEKTANYIIVDVSNPEFLKKSVPLERVIEVYDHHIGFEDYWHKRIGDGAHIEFIGAAATLIYREWKNAGMQNKMSSKTASLLLAAILDNTLNLTSTNTTEEDIEVFGELCLLAHVGEDFKNSYFIEVQKSIEANLKKALFGDIKIISSNEMLPEKVAQLCVWNAESVLNRLPEIREWFSNEPWMINVIDLSKNCSFFLCDDVEYQQKISHIFGLRFDSGIAKTKVPYLRKQIIKRTLFDIRNVQ